MYSNDGDTALRIDELRARYLLHIRLGSGLNGTVWRGRSLSTGDDVAIKVLHDEVAARPRVPERFALATGVLTAHLHPVLVRTREVIAKPHLVALVGELVRGEDLRRMLDRSGVLAPGQAVAIVGEVAAALAAAHLVGVVHCDIKPENILVRRADGAVRVTDCRVARLVHGSQDGPARFATAAYAAPELATGGPMGAAADVHALGAVLYEVLLGRPPRRAEQSGDGSAAAGLLARRLDRDASVPEGVREALRLLVTDCLRPDPMSRPPATTVAARLQGISAAFGEVTTSDAPAAPAMSRPTVDDHPRATDRPPDRDEPDPWAGPRDRDTPRIFVRPTRWRLAVPWRLTAPWRLSRLRPWRLVLVCLAGAMLVASGIATALTIRAAGGPVPSSGPPTPSQASTAVADEQPTGVSDPRNSGHQPGAAPGPYASEQTLSNAAGFARYWFDALTFAVRTGDTAALEAASSESCAVCQDAVDTVRAAYADGGALDGGGYEVRSTLANNFADVDRPVLEVVFDRAPRSVVGPDDAGGGSARESLPGATFVAVQLVLEWDSDRWRVREILTTSDLA